jgi:hypothetical protein
VENFNNADECQYFEYHPEIITAGDDCERLPDLGGAFFPGWYYSFVRAFCCSASEMGGNSAGKRLKFIQ